MRTVLSSSSMFSTLSVEETLTKLHSSKDGLSSTEVTARQARYGPNALRLASPPSLLTLFIRQFRSPLIFLLLLAGGTMAILHSVSDGVLILCILIFNAILGTLQEGKAHRTIQKIRQLSTATAVVVRDGAPHTVDDEQLVPGDVIYLNEGQKVPADARLIEVNGLLVEEATLTGESLPVKKQTHAASSSALSEAHAMVFKGTNIVGGSAVAVVTATGATTIIGSIATTIAHIDTDVPLKKKIDTLSKRILFVVLSFSLLFALASLGRGYTLIETLEFVISVTVSLVPEGLPVILTLVLAISVQRMSKKNALVKKLHAVEALGQATLLAVDKTGTITLNELCVERIWTIANKLYHVTAAGYDPHGQILLGKDTVEVGSDALLALSAAILKTGLSASVLFDEDAHRWIVHGDPTEAALIVAASKLPGKLPKLQLLERQPFDYKKKYSSCVFKSPDGYVTAVIGAPEHVVALGSFSVSERKRIEHQVHLLSSQGLRVVALATHTSSQPPRYSDHPHVSLVSIFGMRDTIHPEAKDAIQKAQKAGIKVVMITGDHVETATAIAKEAGIVHSESGVFLGSQLESVSDDALKEKLPHIRVFARVSPAHKLRLISLYRQMGEVVAMTGDGVNDAASLVAADLGVAMGKSGSEVAKEAADIVLMDDNLHTIITAVFEGRGLYKTLKSVVTYLLSTGTGEALTLFAALLLSLPSPLTAVQILWLNFVTDGFLDVALSMEPHGSDAVHHTRTTTEIIDRTMFTRMVVMGTTMMVGTLTLFEIFALDYVKAITISLTTLAAFQWFNAWNCRSQSKSLFRMSPFSNLYLIHATILVIALQVMALHLPFFQRLLHTTPLSLSEWGMCILVASSIVIVEELRKSITIVLGKK